MGSLMTQPFYCYIGILLSFTVSLWLFATGKLDVATYFYAPLGILIAYFTALAMLTDKQVYMPRSFKQVLPNALGKYLMWGLILSGVLKFYELHPLYNWMTPETRVFFNGYLRLYIRMGLPYFLLTEKTKYCLENVLSDPYIKLRILLRDLWKRRFKQAAHRLTTQRYRRTYLMAILRIHYIPIMVEQIYYGVTQATRFALEPNHEWTLITVVGIVTVMCWLIDSNNGAMGYFWESWLTKTRYRDVDPHAIHWFVVLICYMPFITYAANFVPFPSLPNASVLRVTPLIEHVGVNKGIEVAMLIALVCYVISGSALNFSTSNLCYKKIQTKGPYSIVRHPATTCKLIVFALAFFRFREAFTPVWTLCYFVWFTIYVCRALVEERFLRRFSDYQAYMKQTRYRFIPGLI
jgi:protein-S-isoprenylcysteine O-methyltransferase Ste14